MSGVGARPERQPASEVLQPGSQECHDRTVSTASIFLSLSGRSSGRATFQTVLARLWIGAEGDRAAGRAFERHVDKLDAQVIDQGMGMSADQLAHIGERFFRADKSGDIPGTGLGMSIVKEIMDLMGGRVEVDSHLGQGTTMTLWLPLAHHDTLSMML